ncbi:MAG: hypothetical protein HRU15_01430 [Planctomycetes bacterium]|nr:hypothetical protein [Planctomycetota bacterium]
MLYRAWFLAFCYSCIALVFIGRLFWLQVLEGKRFDQSISSDRHVEVLIPARRGRILDRHGEVLVDNKTVYHLALVLNDLALSRSQTRRHPFYIIDDAALIRISADLALRSGQNQSHVHRAIINELERHPGVALRRGVTGSSEKPQLIAIPKSALDIKKIKDSDRANVARLIEKRMLDTNLRRVLLQELQHHYDESFSLYSEQQWQHIGALLDKQLHIDYSFCAETLAPFTNLIDLDSSDESTNKSLATSSWRLLSDTGLQQGIAHISSYINKPMNEIHDVVRNVFDSARKSNPRSQYYFAPLSQAEIINSLLPVHIQQSTINLQGLPASRERMYIMQGDHKDQEGLADLFYQRLQASLDLDIDWLGELFESNIEKKSATYCERLYHKKQVALDVRKVSLFSKRLAATLARAGIPCDVIKAEQYITDIRRLSDREWRGMSRSSPIPFYKNVPRSIAKALSGSGFSTPATIAVGYDNSEALLPGLRIVTSNGRESLFPGSASHSLGYLGRLDSTMSRQEALSWGLDPSGLRGRNGLEARYDQYLQGTTGRTVKFLNEQNTYIELKQKSHAPIPGQDLQCTLDAQLQHSVEHALQNWQQLAKDLGTSTGKMENSAVLGKNRSGMIIIDCFDGAILAISSNPSYNLNNFNDNYARLLKDPTQPLIDNSTIANRHPGSVVKILMATAGLHEGVVSPTERIYCQGYMTRNSRGQAILRDHASGNLNISEAITKSSNVFFAKIGQRLSAEKIVEWYHRFGLGRKYALDLPWQRPQTIPAPSNIKRLRPREAHWNNFDTWTLSIGQLLKISPLEAITIPAFIANGGTIVQPHLVKPDHTIFSDHIDLHPSHLQAIRTGMDGVTQQGGTARLLRLSGTASGIKVAAKTGTSEWGPRSNIYDHAWLIGYAPAKNPKVAFAIFVHSGTCGGGACSGVAKKALESYFEIYGREGHRR